MNKSTRIILQIGVWIAMLIVILMLIPVVKIQP